jgi:hypothetical protein
MLAAIHLHQEHRLDALALVKEEGEVDRRVALEAVLTDLRRNVKTLSSIDNLRHTFQIPLIEVKRFVHNNHNKVHDHDEELKGQLQPT